MSEIVLKAQNIHKCYTGAERLEVLKGIDLELNKGESIAIMGSSGAGKTTLLHILGTLESFDKGTLTILGRTKLSDAIRNSHIGFIFQSYNLLEDLTLIENVLMPAYIARKNIQKTSPAYKRAELLLEEVGLDERKHFLAKKLSGGEKQRAAIARAFCNDPDIIMADEPSGNLDFENAKIIHNLLLDCTNKFKKSLLIATHNQAYANKCDECFFLEKGIFIKR